MLFFSTHADSFLTLIFFSGTVQSLVIVSSLTFVYYLRKWRIMPQKFIIFVWKIDYHFESSVVRCSIQYDMLGGNHNHDAVTITRRPSENGSG